LSLFYHCMSVLVFTIVCLSLFYHCIFVLVLPLYFCPCFTIVCLSLFLPLYFCPCFYHCIFVSPLYMASDCLFGIFRHFLHIEIVRDI
jgi:hypothetical protein